MTNNRTPDLVSSRNHPLIKRYRSLHQRSERDAAGVFLIEGARFLIRAFEAKARIEQLILAPAFRQVEALDRTLRRLRRAGVPGLCVTRDVFHSLALSEEPQGVAAIVRQEWSALPPARPGSTDVAECHTESTPTRGYAAEPAGGGTLWLAVSRIQSYGNLGTMLRTCEAVGAGGVILLDRSVDPYDPACVRASMGGHFALDFVRANVAEMERWRRRCGLTLIGTSPGGELDYQAARYPSGAVLFLGCERKGLTDEELSLCDQVVRIPMAGRCDSLNVAVATGVLLYEAYNQQRR